MAKINDLDNSLESDLDLFEKKEIDYKTIKKSDKLINDIDNTKKDIDLSLNKKIKIIKLKSKNFDSFFRSKKDKQIDITKPDYNKIDTLKLKIKNIDFNKIDLNKILLNFFSQTNEKLNNKNNLTKKTKIKRKRFNTNFSFRLKKISLVFLFVFTLLFGNKILVENLITAGYEKILIIKDLGGDIESINNNISDAKLYFKLGDILFKPFSLIPNQNIENVDYIIKGGYEFSSLLSESSSLYNQINEYIVNANGIENIYFTELLGKLRLNYENINSLLYSALNNYYKVGDLGDDFLNSKLDFVKSKLMEVLIFSDTINKNYDILLSLLGDNSERKYMVLFQNNDEIRSTGGFIGSVGFITLKDGKIKEIENSDVYALEWLINKVYTDKQEAPEGLDKITETFGLRDANYYPEIKNSSAKIKSFLDMIDYDIDGIVYINQNIILDLLDSVGGVDSEILEQNINSGNFSMLISTLVESKVFKVGTLGTPKQVLFDFADEFIDKLLYEKDYFTYLDIIIKHIQSRDIVFYSFNSDENSLLWKLGVNGEINFNENLDFNYPVYSSIGGNKSDRYIEYRYDKVVNKIEGSCNYETRLDIYNSHNFSTFDLERVNNILDIYGVTDRVDILNIQGLGDNKSYLRILIPKNTEVYLSENQKVYEYDNYKIIELYTFTRNLETSKNTIRYNIINNSCDEYNFKFFKQPGIRDYNLNYEIDSVIEKNTKLTRDFYFK